MELESIKYRTQIQISSNLENTENGELLESEPETLFQFFGKNGSFETLALSTAQIKEKSLNILT